MAQAVSRWPFIVEAWVHPGQSMWDVWWAKWHWGRFHPEFFGFPLPISFHREPPYSYIIWGMNNMPIGGCSSETSSHPIDINNRLGLCHLLNVASVFMNTAGSIFRTGV
jgi:hypothetical protein